MALFVYIHYSSSRNRFYIDTFSQPEERLKKHKHHKGFMASAVGWKIVHPEEFKNKTGALARERNKMVEKCATRQAAE